MDSTVHEIAADLYRISTFHLERAQKAIVQNLAGPLANDMPYTAHTGATLARLAALKPRTLAVMHGSSVAGDCAAAVVGLARFIAATLGARNAT